MKPSLTFLTFSLFISSFIVQAQNRLYGLTQEAQKNNTFKTQSLFTLDSRPSNSTIVNDFKGNTTQAFLRLDSNELTNIYYSEADYLELSVPLNEKLGFDLQLIPTKVTGSDFKVKDAQGNIFPYEVPHFYQGIIKNDPESMVSFSVHKDGVRAIISNAKGNFVLGQTQDQASYVLYNDHDLKEKSPFQCGVVEDSLLARSPISISTNTISNNVTCDTVGVYIEADYDLYQDNSSDITQTANYVTDLMAEVAVLYQNESLLIQVSEIVVWDTLDPYAASTTTGAALASFRNNLSSSYNGDLAHLLSGRSLGGGIAYVGVLCLAGTSNFNLGTGVSANLTSTVVSVPTYSWNVMVVAHELGHNFGSPHTQSCSWPGGAIDGCVSPEGSCSPGPIPTSGGTIMSYCHLSSVGINLSLGFGSLPGALIRREASACFGSSLLPDMPTAYDVGSTAAVLTWENASPALSNYAYKASSASTWNAFSTPNEFVELTGLSSSTTYDFRVSQSCSADTLINFTTTNTPIASYCTPSYIDGCDRFSIGMDSVIIDSVLWNTPGCSYSGVSMYTDTVRSLTIGSSYPFELHPLWIGANPIQATVWIDLNQDGVFGSAEVVFATSTGTTQIINGNIMIPTGLSPVSKTRMRIRVGFSSTPNDPCASSSYGESEDYFVNLVNPCPVNNNFASPLDDIASGLLKEEASGAITATNLISGGEVIYDAGGQVQLNPGFSVQPGAVFKAMIDGCGGQ